MGRPAQEAASPSALAPALLRWAGDDKAAMLAAQAGIEDADEDRDEVPITSTALAKILATLSDDDPHLALRLPTELRFRKFDAGTLAARVAATPADVLGAIARYAPLVFPRLTASYDKDKGELRFRVAGAPRGLGYAVDAYVLATTLTFCRRGIAVTPAKVWLTCPRPHDFATLVQFLGTDEIELGREDAGLVLDAATLTQALPSFDPMLAAAAEHLAATALASAPKRSFAETVRAKLATLPNASAEDVAAAFKMTTRTLQRRLEDEGVRFSALLDEVRSNKARELLRNQALSLGEVAYQLGFSDLATFSRAFKRWTGTPPGTFRRRNP